MPILMTCSGCQASFNVPDALAGKRIRCTSCKAEMLVRGLAARDGTPRRSPPVSESTARQRPAKSRPLRFGENDNGAPSRSRRGDASKKGKSQLPLILGFAGGLVLLLGGVLGIYLATKGSRSSSTVTGDGGSEAKAAGWVKVDDPRFTVYMPKTPRQNISEVESVYDHTEESLLSYGVRVSLVVKVSPFEGPTKPSARELLNIVKDPKGRRLGVFAPDSVGTFRFNDTMQDGYPALECENDMQFHNIRAHIRVIVADDYFIVAGMVGQNLHASDERLRKFFNSLRIKSASSGETPKGSSVPAIPQYTSNDWQPIPDADGFTAEMHGKPHRNDQTTRWYNLRSDREHNLIAYGDEKSLDKACQSLRIFPPSWASRFMVPQDSFEIRPAVESDVSNSGFSGKEFRYLSLDGSQEGYVHLYSVGDRVYRIEAFTPNRNSFHSSNLRRFLNSVKFTGPRASVPSPSTKVPR